MMDLQQYLKPTNMVNSDSEPISQAVCEITKGTETKGEEAIRIFHFVRDEIKFAFTKGFDIAKASYTLQQKEGHCNPKTTLFISDSLSSSSCLYGTSLSRI